MADWSDFADEETGETMDSSNACSQPCPEGDGSCALGLGHGARHACGTDPVNHRWETELPA